MFRTFSGIPVWFTRPYYWEAEPWVYNRQTIQTVVDGNWVEKPQPVNEDVLDRSTDDLDILIYVEPLSGVTMLGYKSLQSNYRVTPTFFGSAPAHRRAFDSAKEGDDWADNQVAFYPWFWQV